MEDGWSGYKERRGRAGPLDHQVKLGPGHSLGWPGGLWGSGERGMTAMMREGGPHDLEQGENTVTTTGILTVALAWVTEKARDTGRSPGWLWTNSERVTWPVSFEVLVLPHLKREASRGPSRSNRAGV
eukprot:757172-Rhodomonas_salina.1